MRTHALNHVNLLNRGRVRKQEALGSKVKEPENTSRALKGNCVSFVTLPKKCVDNIHDEEHSSEAEDCVGTKLMQTAAVIGASLSEPHTSGTTLRKGSQ